MDFRSSDKKLTKWLEDYAIRTYGKNKKGSKKLAIEDAIECLQRFEREFIEYRTIFKNKIGFYSPNT